jgi:hypothetical protein
LQKSPSPHFAATGFLLLVPRDSRSNIFRTGRVTPDIDEALVRDGIAYAQSHGTTLDQMVSEFIQEKVHTEQNSKFLDMLEFANERGFASEGIRLTRDEIYSRD